MWNVKTKVISVIIVTSGTISKSLRPYLSNIPEEHEITELQKKKKHFGHCTYTTESANVQEQNIFQGRHNITCGTNCKYRTDAKLHNLETWYTSGV